MDFFILGIFYLFWLFWLKFSQKLNHHSSSPLIILQILGLLSLQKHRDQFHILQLFKVCCLWILPLWRTQHDAVAEKFYSILINYLETLHSITTLLSEVKEEVTIFHILVYAKLLIFSIVQDLYGRGKYIPHNFVRK